MKIVLTLAFLASFIRPAQAQDSTDLRQVASAINKLNRISTDQKLPALKVVGFELQMAVILFGVSHDTKDFIKEVRRSADKLSVYKQTPIKSIANDLDDIANTLMLLAK